MYLYNTTFKVDLDAVIAFKLFLQEYLENNEKLSQYVYEHQLYKLEGVDESDGLTFCLHFLIYDKETFNMFVVVIDSKLKNELYQNFGEKVLFFSTLMVKQ